MIKKATTKTISELKKLVGDKKLVIGTEITIKKIKQGKIEKIFITSNCPSDIVKDIEHYAEITKSEIIQLTQSNEQLGILCKKPFAISLISVLKSSK